MSLNWYQTQFENVLLEYEPTKAFDLLESFESEFPSQNFIDDVLVVALTAIGEKWDQGDVALSQVYMSSKLCERIAEKLLPKSEVAYKQSPKMGIAVLADHHVLGKKIVKSVLNASGYSLIDLGYGLSPEEIIKQVIDKQIRILIISVLMFPSALQVKAVTDILCQAPYHVKVLVGGAPFILDDSLWLRVGATAMGRNAADDIPVIESWIKEGSL